MERKTLLFLLFSLQITLNISIEESHETEHHFCWKDSYGRGVGSIPTQCGNRDKIGLLCYDKCPSGYKRWGFDCHQTCPSDFRDDGLYCRHAEYGRGTGYPWKFGDGLNDKGMKGRCEKAKGKGNCEKYGAIYYPKCKDGYKNFGCCICRPKETPNCKKLGMNNGIDLSCAKKIQIGSPHTADCKSGLDKDAGLCYTKCKDGYKGVGPVCWGQPPNGWVNCGMGAASSSAHCGGVVFNQIASVGTIAFNIATLGSSGAASTASSSASKTKKLAELRKKLETIKTTIKESAEFKKLAVAAEQAKKVAATASKGIYTLYIMKKTAEAEEDKMTEEDIIRLTAEIASIVDPSGLAYTIASYTYPVCSKILKYL